MCRSSAQNSCSLNRRVSTRLQATADVEFTLLRLRAADEHHDRSKKSLVHVANTERRIRFREVELKPKQAGDAPGTQAQTTAKMSNVAKKVKTQMEHVMSGSAGPSRRGRGGRKRGSSKAQSKGKQRDGDPTAPPGDQPPEENGRSASMEMDTS